MTSGKSNLGLGVQAIGRPLAWSVNGLSSNPSTNKREGEKSNGGGEALQKLCSLVQHKGGDRKMLNSVKKL